MVPWWMDHHELAGFCEWMVTLHRLDAMQVVAILRTPWAWSDDYLQYVDARDLTPAPNAATSPPQAA